MQGSPIVSMMSLCIVMAVLGCRSIEKKEMHMNTKAYAPHGELSGNNISAICHEYLSKAKDIKVQIKETKGNGEFIDTLNLYNELLINIDRGLSQASLMAQVHPDEQKRKEAESCEQEISNFMTELSLDKDIYDALAAGEKIKLKEDEKRLLDHTLRDFRRAGVDKDDKTRARIKKIKEELVKIGQQFDQNIREERLTIKLSSVDELEGMPKDYIDAHPPGPDGTIIISTDYPDYNPIMNYAKNDKVRKELHFKFLNRGQKNESVLRAMLEKRHELAKLLSYSSFADYVVEDKMIKNADNIHSFINKVAKIAKDGADKEYAALLKYKKSFDPKATSVEGYESAYLDEGLKRELFNYDSKAIRPYFSYNKVLDGLLDISSKLYNIKYVPISDAKVWDASVKTYDILDETGKIGRIYLDMHPRIGKYQHAAQFTVVSGIKDRQYPEGALVCNFPDPKTGDGAALMEHKDVVTMFHEFGHLLHHIFSGKQEWIPFSGVATEWDFVETPSQFFEEWARTLEVLQTFALHYKNNEAIPADLVNKMRAASEFGKALFTRQQIFYAALSVNYFDRDPSTFEPLSLLKELQANFSYFPYREGTHFNHNFGHLNGYSAMYYTYMWSLTIAKDLLGAFKKDGLMNTKTATRFKDTILKQGGSKDAAILVEDFLGRPFKFDAFEAWLRSDPMTLAEKP